MKDKYNTKLYNEYYRVIKDINILKATPSSKFESVGYNGLKDGSNAVYTLNNDAVGICVFLNGQLLDDTFHYSKSGLIITIIDALFIPNVDDIFKIKGNF